MYICAGSEQKFEAPFTREADGRPNPGVCTPLKRVAALRTKRDYFSALSHRTAGPELEHYIVLNKYLKREW